VNPYRVAGEPSPPFVEPEPAPKTPTRQWGTISNSDMQSLVKATCHGLDEIKIVSCETYEFGGRRITLTDYDGKGFAVNVSEREICNSASDNALIRTLSSKIETAYNETWPPKEVVARRALPTFRISTRSPRRLQRKTT
jgi:hypothetical protein